MVKQQEHLAKRAENYWKERKLQELIQLSESNGASEVPEVLYFGGLASHALNQKRKAFEFWRSAIKLKLTYQEPIRALAYEFEANGYLTDAAKLFYDLIRLNAADGDDLTTLGEICIKQDRMSEAQQWLNQALQDDENNSLALLAMATLYVHVQDKSLALKYLGRAAETNDLDLSDLASDPEFELLWPDPEFGRLTSAGKS